MTVAWDMLLNLNRLRDILLSTYQVLQHALVAL
uniref:Uncharacterized protein n=1 Tax=Arundo donax TaxID=35708 RepID=A0A0A9AEL9_ARUDO